MDWLIAGWVFVSVFAVVYYVGLRLWIGWDRIRSRGDL